MSEHIALAKSIAKAAHEGQCDKIGVPYYEHARAVGDGLVSFSPEIRAAGYLHDVIEDTRWTSRGLLDAGVSQLTVSLVEAVTNQPGVPYPDKIRTITKNHSATLIKIADNAHNSHLARLEALPQKTRSRLIQKYHDARDILWAHANPHEIRAIISVVNPQLLRGLEVRMVDGLG